MLAPLCFSQKMESKIDELINEKAHDPVFLPIIIEAFPLVFLYS